jgi:tRNA-dihydrouridine synthase 2
MTTTGIFDLERDNERIPLTSQQVAAMYDKTKILAPMVRVGQLPFRYMCVHDYGADVVYTEEIIDKKLLKTQRMLNHELQTVEYVDKAEYERYLKAKEQAAKNTSQNVGTKQSKKLQKALNLRIAYQTSPLYEPKPLVFQVGTANADLALQTAQHLIKDYDVFDVNCGCPKHFSISGGMGAALLKDREKLCGILKNLTLNLNKPVTCKIRLLDQMSDTIDLVKSIEQTGVVAIAVHARHIEQRSRDAAHLQTLEQIKSAINVPLIANGDCFKYEDFDEFREKYKCDAVMTARGALWNPSVFQTTLIPKAECALKLIDYCEQFHCHPINTKYIMTKMWEHPNTSDPTYKQMLTVKTHDDMKKILNDDLARNSINKDDSISEPAAKRIKIA